MLVIDPHCNVRVLLELGSQRLRARSPVRLCVCPPLNYGGLITSSVLQLFSLEAPAAAAAVSALPAAAAHTAAILQIRHPIRHCPLSVPARRRCCCSHNRLFADSLEHFPACSPSPALSTAAPPEVEPLTTLRCYEYFFLSHAQAADGQRHPACRFTRSPSQPRRKSNAIAATNRSATSRPAPPSRPPTPASSARSLPSCSSLPIRSRSTRLL